MKNCKFVSCLQALGKKKIFMLVIVLENVATILPHFQEDLPLISPKLHRFCTSTSHLKPSKYDSISGTPSP